MKSIAKSKKSSSAEVLGKSLNDYIVEFREDMNIGVAAIKRAAKTYAEALIKHPGLAASKFAVMFPTVSSSTWDVLERIGTGDLNENAFLLPYATVNKLARIPIKKQDAMFAKAGKGYEVVNPTTGKTRVIPISSLSTQQANILFDMTNGKIRSVDEQRKYLDERTTGLIRNANEKGRPPKYQICGNVCIIAGVEIGKETLKRILSEMDED